MGTFNMRNISKNTKKINRTEYKLRHELAREPEM